MRIQFSKVALAAVLAFTFAAYGGQQERVAIINTLDNQDSIGFSDLSHLTNRLRETAVNVLPKELYGVMTTESIVAFLGSQENAIRVCNQASCLAEIGRKVSADYVAQGRIGRFIGMFTINFELYSSKSGNLIGSFTGSSLDMKGILAIIDENAPILFRKLPGVVASPIISAFNPALIPEPALVPVAATEALDTAASVEADKQCEKIYNINELVFKVKNVFINQLKDCPSKLTKEAAPDLASGLTTETFVEYCVEFGIGNEIPDGFPGTAQLVGSLKNFVQSALNSAFSVNGALDPNNFRNVVEGMSVEGLLSEVRGLADGVCVVDEPYEPPVAPVSKRAWSFGIRAGLNLSHTYAEITSGFHTKSGAYDDVLRRQIGVVFDVAATERFHIQPGFMFIGKGMSDGVRDIKAHYIEFPILFSLKLDMLRLNVGPYVSVCFLADGVLDSEDTDSGISAGLGFDVGIFYIGMFYNYGLVGSSYNYGEFYNRTLGFNLGVNL